MISVTIFQRAANKKNNQRNLLPSIKPPSVPSSATVAFAIEWVLVRDANVFMGDVPLEYR